MSADAQVLVIGAGVSGLCTAWWLQSAGYDVCVVEAESRPGGTIGTARETGCLIEAGPNSALDTSPLVGRLLEEVGAAGERIDADPAAKNRFVLREGKLVALPLSPPAFIATPLFSWRAKFGLLREWFVPPSPAQAEESVADFVRRRLGAEFLDYAVDPFVAGVYAGLPERLAVKAAFPRLHELEQRYGGLLRGQILGARERRRNAEKSKQAAPMFSFREGMQALTDAIAARLLRLELCSRASALALGHDGTWEAVVAGPAGEARTRASSVVLATPAHAAARLVEPLAAQAAQALASIPYPPVASVASQYARADVGHRLDGFGFLVPRKERRRILGTIFSSTLFAERAPQGTVLLTTFVGGSRQPEAAELEESAIAALVQEELASLLQARAEPKKVWVTRWQRAIPQYTLGHLARMEAIDAAERQQPGLFFCANYRGGVSVADCIKSSRAVAERVERHLAR